MSDEQTQNPQVVEDVKAVTGSADFEAVLSKLTAEQAPKEPEKADPSQETADADVSKGKTAEATNVEDKSPESKPDETGVPNEYRFGDAVYTADEIEEALKSHKNRTDWNSKLTLKGKAISLLNGLDAEKQELLISQLQPFIDGRQSVPETPKDLIESVAKDISDLIPESLRFKDEDGIDVDVPKAVYGPVIEKVIGAVIQKGIPGMATTRGKLGEVETKYQELESSYKDLSVRNGELTLQLFSSVHPEILPQKAKDDETLLESFARLAEAGPEHPEYDKLLIIEAVTDLAQKNKLTFESAYNKLYGTQIKRQKQEEKVDADIAKRQAEAANAEKPGAEKPPDPMEDLYKVLPKSRDQIVEEMMRKQTRKSS